MELIVAILLLSCSAFAGTKERSSFTDTELLTLPLTVIPGRPSQFNTHTLYTMRNFLILQKLSIGYLLTPNSAANDVNDYGIVFLKTSKQFPSNIKMITGELYYIGEFTYTNVDGFEETVPMLKSIREE